MIKYLGSKRVLVPVLGEVFAASQARTALDLFTGTTRVAQEMCRRGLRTTAVDIATYSEALAHTYVATDADSADHGAIAEALARLNYPKFYKIHRISSLKTARSLSSHLFRQFFSPFH